MSVSVPFDRVGHFIRVRATLGDEDTALLVDTGIGVNVVSTRLADRLGLRPTGRSFSGRRMSGQLVTAPLVRIPTITLGDHEVGAQDAGVIDLDDGAPAFDGILGLGCFEEHAVTTDPDARTLTILPTGSLAEGDRVPLEVRRQGPSVAPFARLTLPDGQTITVEVDTGSGALILDARFVDRGDVTVEDMKTTTGVDETGFEWTRRCGVLAGAVHLDGAPHTSHAAPPVIVQDIIHDGLVGTEYLERFRYTVDVAAAVLVLAPRESGS